MSRLPYISFYPHEWLTMTSHMTLEQRGLFIQIVAMIYARKGRIKNDPAHIARISNCSLRLAKSVISQLFAQGDIQSYPENDELGQKRAEHEIEKRQFTINSAEIGGRKSAELRAQSLNINGNPSTTKPDHTTSIKTPSENLLHVRARGEAPGFFENGEGGKWSIVSAMSDLGMARARTNAPGWDIYFLAGIYNESVAKRGGKPNNPDAAFPAWCLSFTKGKPPQ